MVAAYKMAAVAEFDILEDVEKEGFCGLRGCLKERKRLRMNWRIGLMGKPRRNGNIYHITRGTEYLIIN